MQTVISKFKKYKFVENRHTSSRIISVTYCLRLKRNNVEIGRERDRKKGRKKETIL
jgi:hypothetical protein